MCTSRKTNIVPKGVQKGKQLIEVIIEVIIDEMGRGNFSFLILLIGILQFIVMLKKKR